MDTRAEWAWGCDVSSKRIAFGALELDGPGASSWSAEVDPGLRGAERLAAIRRHVVTLSDLAWVQVPAPSAIVVENPANRTLSFVLLTVAGVVMEGLYTTFRCPVLELATGKWKKEVLGHGHASKEAAMAHAFELGGRPANQDEADALCIAEAARIRLERATDA